jgi:superoxide dismutase, Fe-Mn family
MISLSNHTIFWQIMSPKGGGEPTGAIAQEINQTFGSFDAFKNNLTQQVAIASVVVGCG